MSRIIDARTADADVLAKAIDRRQAEADELARIAADVQADADRLRAELEGRDAQQRTKT